MMFLNYIKLLGSVFLGWALGANNAANVFGGAVASHMVKFRVACIFMAVFIIAGAILHGTHGIETLGALTGQTINTAFIVTIATAITGTIMTLLHVPISISQAVVGAIIGVGILQGDVNVLMLRKVLMCWIATPFGGIFFAGLLYVFLGRIVSNINLHFIAYDRLMRLLLIIGGSYSAYAFGANNVANTTGVFYRAGLLTAKGAALIGGISIAFGAVTFSKNVMMTVGRKLLNLDAFSAFIVILAEAITVHIFALVGVPVPATQAVIGGVLGIGLVKGIRTVDLRVLKRILYAWIFSPLISGLFAYSAYRLFR